MVTYDAYAGKEDSSHVINASDFHFSSDLLGTTQTEHNVYGNYSIALYNYAADNTSSGTATTLTYNTSS